MTNEHNNQGCLIFPHIPKCSGSSLKAQFETSQLKVYFDYDKPPHDTIFFQKECNQRNIDTSMLNFGAFDLVFGHFPIQRYNKNNYQYITLIRHPVERAISHFFYWKNLLPESNKLALHRNPIISEIKNGNFSFLDFVKTRKCSSVYSDYLGDIPPKKFLLVGFTEHYGSFIKDLSEIINIELTADIKGQKDLLKNNEINQAKSILKDEIDKYELFYKYWT